MQSNRQAVTPIEPLVYASRILADYNVKGRTIRKWIAVGKFPKPDGNLNGRNFWLAPTYRDWQRAVHSGEYAQVSPISRASRHRAA